MSTTPPSKWTRTKSAIVGVLAAGTLIGGTVGLTYAFWPEDAATAKSDFCDSTKDFASTVQSYQGLNPVTATNDQIDAAYDDIESAYDEMIDQGNEWVNAYDNELTNWYYDMDAAIESLPSDNTATENLEDLEPTLSEFPAAFQSTFDKSGCQ